MDRVRGKTALVTGGARSLGKAQCLLLADEGANVIVTDLLVDEGKKTAEEIIAKGGKAFSSSMTYLTKRIGKR